MRGRSESESGELRTGVGSSLSSRKGRALVVLRGLAYYRKAQTASATHYLSIQTLSYASPQPFSKHRPLLAIRAQRPLSSPHHLVSSRSQLVRYGAPSEATYQAQEQYQQAFYIIYSSARYPPRSYPLARALDDERAPFDSNRRL
jgi:hypothetical protein